MEINFESDDFYLEDKILSDISISYYPDFLLKSPTDKPAQSCIQCKNEIPSENLFIVQDTKICCNFCLPMVIQITKAERKFELQKEFFEE